MLIDLLYFSLSHLYFSFFCELGKQLAEYVLTGLFST